MRIRFSILLLLLSSSVVAQDITLLSQDITINRFIDGTLLIPNDSNIEEIPLAIIIAGSGPTDRNGNQNFMQNNALKKLAESLSKNGIATFRYDKRSVKLIRQGNTDIEIMFDDFIADAVSVLDYFKTKYNFKSISIIGHSQGSLIGMVAAQQGADSFISIAGAGNTIDEVIVEQVELTAPMFTEDTKRVFAVLKEGKTTTDFPPALTSFLSVDVQPFMSNWMSYDPKHEIDQLDIPILIINGSKDLQVSESEARLLYENTKNADIVIIDKMNHVLVPIEGDALENSKSYNESGRKLSSDLIDSIVNFVKNE